MELNMVMLRLNRVETDKKMRTIWSPLAVDRVSEIAEYIAQDNPVAAEKWTERFFQRLHS